MNDKALFARFAPLLFGIGLITPFFFLMWEWALFIVLMITVIIPLVSKIPQVLFRKNTTPVSVKRVGFRSGIANGITISTALVILGFEIVSFDLTVFTLLLILAYSTNQIAQILKDGSATNKEARIFECYGFIATLPPISLIWWFWV